MGYIGAEAPMRVFGYFCRVTKVTCRKPWLSPIIPHRLCELQPSGHIINKEFHKTLVSDFIFWYNIIIVSTPLCDAILHF